VSALEESVEHLPQGEAKMKLSKPTQRALSALLAAGSTCGSAGLAVAAPATTETATPVTTVSAHDTEILPGHNGLTLNGVVGLPLNPTANIPNQKSYRLQADYFELGDLNVDNNFYDSSFNNGTFGRDFADTKFYGVHIAGRPFKAPIELSGGIEKLRARGNTLDGPFNDNNFEFEDLDTTSFAVGAKWQFYRNAAHSTAVAVGAGYSRALFHNYNAYLVGSKVLNAGRRSISAHLGVRYDHFKVEGEDFIPGPPAYRFEDSSSKVSIYAGAEVPIDRRGRFSFVGEVASKNGSDFNFGKFTFPDAAVDDAHLRPKFPYSASIRYANNGLAASIGVMRQGIATDSGLFVQIGKTF
jgi:hypothetical protein